MGKFDIDDDDFNDLLDEETLRRIEEEAIREVESSFELDHETMRQIEESVLEEMGLDSDFDLDDIDLDDIGEIDLNIDLDDIDLSEYEIDLSLEETDTETPMSVFVPGNEKKPAVRLLDDDDDIPSPGLEKPFDPSSSQETKIRLIEDDPEEIAKREAFKRARQRAIEEQTKKAVVDAKRKAKFKMNQEFEYGPSVYREKSEADIQKKKMIILISIAVGVFAFCFVIISLAIMIKGQHTEEVEEQQAHEQHQQQMEDKRKPGKLHGEIVDSFRTLNAQGLTSEQRMQHVNSISDKMKTIKTDYPEYYQKNESSLQALEQRLETARLKFSP